MRTKNAQYFCYFQICCWRKNNKQVWNTRYRQQSFLNSTKHATLHYTVVNFNFLGACTPFLVSLSFSLFSVRKLDFFETLTSHLSPLWIIEEVLSLIRTLTWPYAIFQWMRAVLLAFVDLITRAPLSFLENVRKAVVSRWMNEVMLQCNICIRDLKKLEFACLGSLDISDQVFLFVLF